MDAASPGEAMFLGGSFFAVGLAFWAALLYARRKPDDSTPGPIGQLVLNPGRQAAEWAPGRGRGWSHNLRGIGVFAPFTIFLVVGPLVFISALLR